MNNQDLLEVLAEKKTKTFDGGDLLEALRGKELTVWLNPPGVIRDMFADKTNTEGGAETYKRYRAVVATMYETDRALVDRLSDSIVLALFNFAWSQYLEYDEQLRKNSPSG